MSNIMNSIYQQYPPAQQHLANQAQQGYSMGYGNPQGMSQGAALLQAAAQAQQAAMNSWTVPKWMIDGKSMNFKEFLDTLFPEDCPEKTLIALKYTKGDE